MLCDGSSSSVNDDDDDDDDAEDEQDRSSDPLDDEEFMKVCNEQHRSYGKIPHQSQVWIVTCKSSSLDSAI